MVIPIVPHAWFINTKGDDAGMNNKVKTLEAVGHFSLHAALLSCLALSISVADLVIIKSQD